MSKDSQKYKAVNLDTTKCIGCINCMRRCPVRAIRVRDGKAAIDYDKCVFCGNCVRACPTHAIYTQTDGFDELAKYKYNVALLPSGLYGEFPHIYSPQLILNSLKNIGFDHAFEVARAADVITIITKEKFIMREFEETPVISNVCPACVRLILKNYPALVDNLMTLLPPFILAGKMAREEAREKTGLKDGDIGVFYISPCPAKVEAIKNNFYGDDGGINGAIAVSEVCKRLNTVDKDDVVRTDDLVAGNMGIAWCTSGGQAACIPNTKQLAVDGMGNVVSVLKELEDGKLNNIDFAELRACHAGCVGGVLNITNTFVAKSKIHTLRKSVLLNKTNCTDKFDKPLAFYSMPKKWETDDVYALDKDIGKAMKIMSDIEDVLKRLPRLDCGVCGSPTCRSFAEDVVKGDTELQKCVRYLKNDDDGTD